MGPKSYKFRIVVLPAKYVIFAKKKAPAAARKTSTRLIHVIKYQDLSFLPKKRRLRQPGTPHQAQYMS